MNAVISLPGPLPACFSMEDEIYTSPDPAVADVTTSVEYLESSFYYQPNASSAIMQLAHFPDSVLPLLQMEILATKEAATIFDCSMMVEFGCYDGRALEAARFSRIPYLGIDTDEGAILQLRERIRKEHLREFADAIVGDVLDPALWGKLVLGPKPLYLLPFNLLGNFRDPSRLLSSLSEVGGLAMFSVFNSSPTANNTRRDYYARCGIRDLKCSSVADHGILFTGANGFYSRSFEDEALRLLIKNAGGVILRTTRNCIGQCFTVQLGDNPGQKRTGAL